MHDLPLKVSDKAWAHWTGTFQVWIGRVQSCRYSPWLGLKTSLCQSHFWSYDETFQSVYFVIGEKISHGWSFASSVLWSLSRNATHHRHSQTTKQNYSHICTTKTWHRLPSFRAPSRVKLVTIAGCFSTRNQYCIYFAAASMYSEYPPSSPYIISFAVSAGKLVVSLQAYKCTVSVCLFSL